MNKQIQICIVFITMIFFIACGGGGGSGSSLSNAGSSSQGTAQLGNLKNANVSIYKIENDGLYNLLWREKTSSGTTLNKIGKFNTHSDKLNDEDYYLYKVVGGKDCDANDDGILDKTCTENNGIIRLIATGNDIKIANNNLRITYVSELVYEKVTQQIKDNFNKTNLQTQLQNIIPTIIKDTNQSGSVNMQDMIQFNPAKDKSKLIDHYKYKLQSILNNIHNGIISFYNPNRDNSDAQKVTLSSDKEKINLYDYNGMVSILNISDPTNIKLIKSYNTTFTNPIEHVVFSSDKKISYVVNKIKGLKIFDVSDPINPILLGTYNLSGYTAEANNIKLSKDGTKAYVAYGGKGLVIFDVSDPTDPILISSYQYGYANNVVLSKDGTKAYVAAGTKGLIEIDISKSETPKLIASYNISTASSDIASAYSGQRAYDVVLSKDETKAYVAYGSRGLIIFNVQ
jgi:hypothetical protein